MLSRKFMTVLGVGTGAALLVQGGRSEARGDERVAYDIPAGDLATELRSIAGRGGREILFRTDELSGLRGHSVSGVMAPEAAVRAAIADTPLVADINDGTILVHRSPSTSGAPSEGASTGGIVVTGSRIRGAAPTSETLSISERAIELSGMTDLGQVVRSLPQSFGGGQNPGVGSGAPLPNENLNGASTINLRGLGGDATLTLINGHRVAYTSAIQAVDVTMVPVAALDTLEIVPDGASAIYGSDAVGGVANIILKRDYEGLATSAHVGGSTDGGGFEQRYAAVTGDRWQTGGVMVAGTFIRDTAIFARQRSYTDTMSPDATLVPRQKQYSFVLNGHQLLAPSLSFEIDSIYSHRRILIVSPFTTGPVEDLGYYAANGETSFEVAPRLKFALAGDWRIALTGVYGFDRSPYALRLFADGVEAQRYGGFYTNSVGSAEASADGPLFRPPAGAVKLAVGAGFRRDTLHAQRDDGIDFRPSRRNAFAYAELSVPIVSPETGRPGLRRLTLSGAVRYEHYYHLASLATPRIGILYEPITAISVKGSWGRSFKAPTLYQSYFPGEAYLYPASQAGCATCSPEQTVLQNTGGNADLKPETAHTASATVEVHPASAAGAKLSVTYFKVRYKNRVAVPVSPFSTALTNPAFAPLVQLSPSRDFLDGVVATIPQGVYDYTGNGYDPVNVYAYVDGRYVNVSRQAIDGVDVQASYTERLASTSDLTAAVNASYLHTKQAIIAGQPAVRTSGTIFDPPTFRGRASLVLTTKRAALSAYVNYIGGVRDDRYTPRRHVGSLTSLDLTATTTLPVRRGLLRGIELIASIENVTNAKPSRISVVDPSLTSYDSTNYSAAGRVLGMTISKRW